MTEAEAVERATQGDAQAIRELYERYAPLVFTVVRRITGDHDAACDCAQETWIRVVRALPSFRGEARFSSWLHRIAVNAAIQMGREVERRSRREEAAAEPVTDEAGSRDPLLGDRLESALDRLPDGMRKVLVLHDVEGCTHHEIGAALGITSGTSKSQLFKARAKMRELLAGAPRNVEGVEAWNT
jgi:RNA polymerase sigma-70 factor (ECF subfamily)